MNSDFLTGKIICNRYEVLNIIGSGGMATVYRAQDTVLNRFVALKVLKDALKSDSEVVKKFSAESRAAARLSHPNIVQVYDVGECEGLDYIVMEYVDGITLKEYINRKGRLSWEQACNFAVQIGKAIDCAHANNIIHRDIKPHNVLITADKKLKVSDFGIAQAASGETRVADSAGMGSVHYISPEQARGGYTDERSDIYSLGVVLYEMLTGKVPFDGPNPVSVALMKLEQEPANCAELADDIPEDVAAITMKAISKEQHLRYQSASAMVSDLQTALGGQELSAEDIFNTKRIAEKEAIKEMRSKRSAAKKKKAQNTRIALIAVAAAVLLGIGTYFFMSGGTQEYMVPDLSNLTLEEAEAKLEEDKEADLTLDEVVVTEESDEVEEGKIISQKPGANQYVKKGRKIKVTISSGKGEGKETEVPDVENLTFDEAEKRLADKGFKAKRVDKFSDTIQFEYVISQTPQGGTKAQEGYTVVLYVSADVDNPDEQAVVPKVTGVTEDKARELITAAGLSVGNVEGRQNQAQEGLVIEQTPSAKTGVEKGSKVNFVVSTGPDEEPTPEPTQAPMVRKTLTITIPDSANDTVHIRAVANGKTIYDKQHSKSEKTVDIPVQSSKDASVQVYMDGVLVADKIVTFE